MRPAYARATGRDPDIVHNRFWSGPALAAQFKGFERASKFLHYASLERFLESYPFYVPYDRGYWEHAPSAAKLAYYRLMAKLPGLNYLALPNLAGTFRRC